MVLGTLEDGSGSTMDLELGMAGPPEGQLPAAAGPAVDEAEPASEQPGEEAPQAMSEALLEEYDYERPKRGDVRKGAVLAIQPTEIVVDIGAKRECIVPASDLQKMGDEAIAQMQVGDQVSAYIVKPESREGHLIGSLYLAQMEVDWNHAEELERSGQVFEGRVSGQNRGGALVPFGRLRGFVPASHLIGAGSDAGDQAQTLSRWIGKTLPFKVIEVNRRRNRLILSHRAARRHWRSQQKQLLLESLTEGEIRQGTVSSLASFGAFVDLGGADGLVHVSELAWYRVDHPSDLLQIGQEVEVYVLRVDRERGRIGLSLKRLQRDPWDLADETYTAGQNVEGRITKLVDFGAFVELEKGVEGLIHITELADPAPGRPEEIVMPGDVHLLRVLRVDAQNRRIGLSLKAVSPLELEEWEAARYAAEAEEASDEPPAEAEPEAVSEEPPAEAEPEAVSDETPAEVEAQEASDETPAEVEAEEASDEPPAEVEAEEASDEPPAEVEPEAVSEEPPAEVEPEAVSEEPPAEVEPEEASEEPPAEAQEASDEPPADEN